MPEDTLTWRSWPLVQRPMASLALVVFILAVSLYSLMAFGHLMYSVIALVVLVGAVSDHIFPTTYRLDGEGITVRGPFQTKHRKWDEFRYFATGPRLILLTNDAEMEAKSLRHNLWLRVPHNRDEVAAFLAGRLEDVTPPAKGSAEGGASD